MSTPTSTGSAGVALIKQFEGLRLARYLDAVGKPTIGYGHLIRPGESFDRPITEAQAEALLKADLADAERAIASFVKVGLSQPQFDALASFIFNLGSGNFRGSTLLATLNDGNYAGAADQFLRWDRAGGQVLAGLSRRRAAERILFLTPEAA